MHKLLVITSLNTHFTLKITLATNASISIAINLTSHGFENELFYFPTKYCDVFVHIKTKKNGNKKVLVKI